MTDRVTIELKENKEADKNGNHTYLASIVGGGTVNIIVERTTDPPGSNFYRYTHKVSNGEPQFTLKKVQGDGSQKIEEIPPNNSDGKATAVSAYYWTGNTNKDILVEVAYTGSGTTYYKNSGGNQWVEQIIGGEELEKVLDQQNCYSNNAVTLDLTTNAYGTGKLHCCDGHKEDSKVSIASVPVHNNHAHQGHQHVGSKSLTVTKYSITNGKLAAIKLGDSGKKKKKRITFKGPSFPITGPVDISALYSGNNQEPVLIYIDASKSDKKYQANTGWYQNNGSGGEWTKADELGDATPETINNCRNWSKLVKELDEHSDSDLQDCPELDKQERQETRAGPSGLQAPPQPGTAASTPTLKASAPEATKPTTGTPVEKPPQEGKGPPILQGEKESVLTESDKALAADPQPAQLQQNKSAEAPELSAESLSGADTVISTSPSAPEEPHDLIKASPPTISGYRNIIALPGSKGENAALKGHQQEAHPEAAAKLEASVPSAPKAEQLVAETVATGSVLWTAFGSTSGTLAGSAATFFAGWKLYNRYKGDPWVR